MPGRFKLRLEEICALASLLLLAALKVHFGGGVLWATYFTRRGLGLFAVVGLLFLGLSLSRARGLDKGAPLALTLLRRGVEFVRDWAPFIFLIAVYENLLPLIGRFRSTVYDPLFLQADIALFGVTPSVWLEPLVTPARTQWFAFFYVSLFALPVVSGGLLYLSGRRREFRQFLGAFTLLGYLGYLGYLILPVVGPRYFFPEQYRVSLSGIPARAVALELLSAGSPSFASLAERLNSQGLGRPPVPNCFPSLHTAWGLLVLAFAYRQLRPLFFVYLLPVASLIVATVYLRFHYLVDLAAGALLAVIVSALFFARAGRGERNSGVADAPNLLALPAWACSAAAHCRKRLRKHWPALALLLLVAPIYASSLPTGVTERNRGQDGAELVTAALTGGTAHPPGYPLYSLLLRGVCSLFPGCAAIDVAHALSSAFALSAGIVLIALCRGWFVGSAPQPPGFFCDAGAFLAGASFCLSVSLFGQALIAEVYALHALLIVGMTYTAVRLIESHRSSTRVASWQLRWFGLISGLASSHHLSALPVLLAVLVVLAGTCPSLRSLKSLLDGGLAFAVGLLPWAYLPLATARNPVLAWGQPDSVERWWWVVSAAQYRARLASGFGDWCSRLVQHFPPRDAAPLILGFATLGIVRSFVERNGENVKLRTTALLMGAVLVVNVASTSAYAIPDIRPYFLPAEMALCALAGLGFVRVAVAVSELPRLGKYARECSAALGMCALVWALCSSIRRVDAHGQHPLDRRVRAIIGTAPAQALIAARGDAMVFGLWYERFLRSGRSDVDIVSRELLLQPWYRDNTDHFSAAMRWPLEALRGPASERLAAVLRANYGHRPLVVVHPLDVPPGCRRLAGGLLDCGK
jgi:hypothetical protein